MNPKLKKKLDKILEEQKKNWKNLIYGKELGFYQSLEKAGITGQRSTEQRFEDYGIKEYLSPDKTVLDIGANTGFFSIYISEFIKKADCIEINPYLSKIGEEVGDYLGIKNVSFFKSDFKNFNPHKKYDIVMSFAADEVADGLCKLSFEDYINKILMLSNKDALLFFESQAEDIMFNRFEKKLKIIEKNYKILLKKGIGSTYPTNVKNRVFLIGERK